jgi:hypothetical protein
MEAESLQATLPPKVPVKRRVISHVEIFNTCKSQTEQLSKLKIKPFVKKIQNYRNKYTQHVRRKDKDRTATRNYEIKRSS